MSLHSLAVLSTIFMSITVALSIMKTTVEDPDTKKGFDVLTLLVGIPQLIFMIWLIAVAW